MPEHDERGIPILPLLEKVEALRYCLDEQAWEDAAGHLCDLLEHCRRHLCLSFETSVSDLYEMIDYYGENPTPLDDKGKP